MQYPILEYGILFALSFGLSYYLARRGGAVGGKLPEPGERLKVRLPGGAARAVLASTDSSSWKIGPILRRFGSPAPRAGDLIVVTSASKLGATHFRSRVSDVDGAFLTIDPPKKLFSRDRRDSPRLTPVASVRCKLDGVALELRNLSTKGACLLGPTPASPGDRLHIEMPSGMKVCYVLAASGPAGNRSIRVLFESPLPRLPKKLNCPTLG